MLYITISILLFITIMLIAISASLDPNTFITMLKSKPKRFRIHKPKNESYYYLQIKFFFIWYYIYRQKDEYNLALYTDRFCIKYNNHVIISKWQEIMNDRYIIVKFFNSSESQEDNINL